MNSHRMQKEHFQLGTHVSIVSRIMIMIDMKFIIKIFTY